MSIDTVHIFNGDEHSIREHWPGASVLPVGAYVWMPHNTRSDKWCQIVLTRTKLRTWEFVNEASVPEVYRLKAMLIGA